MGYLQIAALKCGIDLFCFCCKNTPWYCLITVVKSTKIVREKSREQDVLSPGAELRTRSTEVQLQCKVQWWTMTHTHALTPIQVVLLFPALLSLDCREIWQTHLISQGKLRGWQIWPEFSQSTKQFKALTKIFVEKDHSSQAKTLDCEHIMQPDLSPFNAMYLRQTWQQVLALLQD